jgi:16S rRNA G966 N2-methylase RsmD
MLIDAINRKFYAAEDFLFEKRLGIELSGNVNASNLITTFTTKSHAVEYRPVYTRNLRELFNESQKTAYTFENFIDIGSGKGKACFYAYTKRIFNNIIGIEFSEPLVEIANRNKVKIKSENIKFINADAAEFELPQKNNLIFMFNPFDSVVLEKFISNNIEHFRKNNSVIAYANDIQRLSLTKFGFETIFRNQSSKISLYQLT